MHERNDYVGWMLFFVAGGLAGAGAALLLAPQSGRETRDRVGRRLRRAARKARRLRDRASGADERTAARPDEGAHRMPAAGGTVVAG